MKDLPYTARQLYDMFIVRYSIGELNKSIELQTLFNYLFEKQKIKDGEYVLHPSEYIKDLLIKHLGVDYPDLNYKDQLPKASQ